MLRNEILCVLWSLCFSFMQNVFCISLYFLLFGQLGKTEIGVESRPHVTYWSHIQITQYHSPIPELILIIDVCLHLSSYTGALLCFSTVSKCGCVQMQFSRKSWNNTKSHLDNILVTTGTEISQKTWVLHKATGLSMSGVSFISQFLYGNLYLSLNKN